MCGEEAAACASMVLSSRRESTAATPTEAPHSSHGAPGRLEPSKTWSNDETSSGPKPSVSAFIAVSTPCASPTTGGATTCRSKHKAHHGRRDHLRGERRDDGHAADGESEEDLGGVGVGVRVRVGVGLGVRARGRVRARATARVRVGESEADHCQVERRGRGGGAVEAEGEDGAREAEAHLVGDDVRVRVRLAVRIRVGVRVSGQGQGERSRRRTICGSVRWRCSSRSPRDCVHTVTRPKVVSSPADISRVKSKRRLQ
eukprot:scaffold41220_cov71-Phaeocystis_antarctica.AAC.5